MPAMKKQLLVTRVEDEVTNQLHVQQNKIKSETMHGTIVEMSDIMSGETIDEMMYGATFAGHQHTRMNPVAIKFQMVMIVPNLS